MTTFRAGLLAAVFCAALAAQPRPVPLDEAGFQKLIAANKGSVLLVDFWATWCAPCRAEMPQLVRLESKYRARGLKLATVSADEPEQEAEVARFLAERRVPGPVYAKRAKNDEKFINSVDPKWSGALPALFVYDRQGRKVKSIIGETDMAALEALIAKLVAAR